MSTEVNQMALRDAFMEINNHLGSLGRDPIVSPSDVRLEQLIVQNTTSYAFYVLNTDQNPAFSAGKTNTEIRLNTFDTFYAVLMGMYLAAPTSATDTTFVLETYNNATAFGAGAAAFQTFYNSLLNMSINNVQYLQNISTMRFRYVPDVQNGLGFGAATLAGGGVISTVASGFNGCESSLSALGGIVEINGQQKFELTLVLPAALSAAPATAFQRIVIIMRGFLALNAAKR